MRGGEIAGGSANYADGSFRSRLGATVVGHRPRSRNEPGAVECPLWG